MQLQGTDYLLYCVIQAITSDLFDNIAAITGTEVEADGTPTKFGTWEYAVFSLIAVGHKRDEVDDGSAVVLAKLCLKYALIEVRCSGRFEQIYNAWSNKDLVLEAIKCAYVDAEDDHPVPPDLLRHVYQHHRWDMDF